MPNSIGVFTLNAFCNLLRIEVLFTLPVYPTPLNDTLLLPFITSSETKGTFDVIGYRIVPIPEISSTWSPFFKLDLSTGLKKEIDSEVLFGLIL